MKTGTRICIDFRNMIYDMEGADARYIYTQSKKLTNCEYNFVKIMFYVHVTFHVHNILNKILIIL